MNIMFQSDRVLNYLVEEFKEKEDSYAPVFTISMNDFANKLSLSSQQLNLCIWILNDLEYLKTSTAYNKEADAKKEIVFTPKAFSKVESYTF